MDTDNQIVKVAYRYRENMIRSKSIQKQLEDQARLLEANVDESLALESDLGTLVGNRSLTVIRLEGDVLLIEFDGARHSFRFAELI